MPTLDLVVQENYGRFNFSNPVMPPERFDVYIYIGKIDSQYIYIGKIDSQAVKLLLDFGDPKGYDIVTPAPQWGYFYAFARIVPDPVDMYRWDTDQRSDRDCTSRLVRPTSISFRHAGRVRYNEDGSVRQAFPAWLRGVDPDSWLPAEPQYRDWLIEEEMVEVKTLFQHTAAVTLPVRVSRAFW